MWEVNGNLDEEENYNNFLSVLDNVMLLFKENFGIETMDKIDIYVDNATAGSGYTPIITPIHRKYIIIKLNISNFLASEQIAYQFAHELCHYVFYSKLGINKKHADNMEETICSAMSLCIINVLYPKTIRKWTSHVNRLENRAYKIGAILAKDINYDFGQLKDIIENQIKEKEQINTPKLEFNPA